jgi:DNA-binding beta-propeller fold protein YncE
LPTYNPVTGAITGPVGALPIQTPVSPDGKSMVTANMLTGTITVIDTRPGVPTSDTVVAMLPCDPGCHGVQYGAKQGGGYYAYVASKFSNRLLVVDPDPNGDGNPSDAVIAGKVAFSRLRGPSGMPPLPGVRGWEVKASSQSRSSTTAGLRIYPPYGKAS